MNQRDTHLKTISAAINTALHTTATVIQNVNRLVSRRASSDSYTTVSRIATGPARRSFKAACRNSSSNSLRDLLRRGVKNKLVVSGGFL